MNAQAKLPESGYFIEKVYANHLALTVQRPEEGEEKADLYFHWDWKVLAESVFEVTIGLLMEPTEDRCEQVEVSMIGLFRQGSGDTEVPLADFVRYHAPAILMPYVREAIGSLTGRGFYSARYLPALNVQRLMDQQDPSKATGALQLARADARGAAARPSIGKRPRPKLSGGSDSEPFS